MQKVEKPVKKDQLVSWAKQHEFDELYFVNVTLLEIWSYRRL